MNNQKTIKRLSKQLAKSPNQNFHNIIKDKANKKYFDLYNRKFKEQNKLMKFRIFLVSEMDKKEQSKGDIKNSIKFSNVGSISDDKKKKALFFKKKEKEMLEKLHENKKREDFLKNSNSKIDSKELLDEIQGEGEMRNPNAKYDSSLKVRESKKNSNDKLNSAQIIEIWNKDRDAKTSKGKAVSNRLLIKTEKTPQIMSSDTHITSIAFLEKSENERETQQAVSQIQLMDFLDELNPNMSYNKCAKINKITTKYSFHESNKPISEKIINESSLLLDEDIHSFKQDIGIRFTDSLSNLDFIRNNSKKKMAITQNSNLFKFSNSKTATNKESKTDPDKVENKNPNDIEKNDQKLSRMKLMIKNFEMVC